MAEPLYLDHNATTPERPEAVAAFLEAAALGGNPSSVHAFGRAARARLESDRRKIAAFAGAPEAEVIFTSGGTEANNLALKGSGRRRLLVSAGEHPSVLEAAPAARRLPLERDGRLSLAALERALAEAGEPRLVSLMLANNETGVIQPVAEAARLCRAAGALLHCDAVQAGGKLPIEMEALGVDLLTLSAHKFGGPPGVGALLLRPGLELTAQQQGGGQEKGRRAGTENLPGVAAFAAAAQVAQRALPAFAELAALRDALELGLKAGFPGVRVFGAEAPRLANTSCLALPGLAAETTVIALDLAGVAVSSGSACSSGKVTPSHVLAAMGASGEEARSAIRVSFGWTSRPQDVERFLAACDALHLGRERRKMPA